LSRLMTANPASCATGRIPDPAPLGVRHRQQDRSYHAAVERKKRDRRNGNREDDQKKMEGQSMGRSRMKTEEEVIKNEIGYD